MSSLSQRDIERIRDAWRDDRVRGTPLRSGPLQNIEQLADTALSLLSERDAAREQAGEAFLAHRAAESNLRALEGVWDEHRCPPSTADAERDAMVNVVEAAREMNEAAKNVIAHATFHHDAKTIPLEDALVDAWGPFNHALVALDAVKEKDRAAEAELR